VYGFGREAEEGLTVAFSNLLRWQAEELHAQIERGEKIFVVDIRTPEDRSGEPEEIPGAHWVPLANLIECGPKLPRDVTVVTYCT
jgi:rhodanese-related sulfurtransferase